MFEISELEYSSSYVSGMYKLKKKKKWWFLNVVINLLLEKKKKAIRMVAQ